MTIDEAILHCEEVIKDVEKHGFFRNPDNIYKCAEDHRQIAEWLRELKAYKGKYHQAYMGGAKHDSC